MSGFSTNGLPVLGLASTTGNEQAAFDTELTQGVAPESVAIGGNALGLGVQKVAAFGASQGNATQIGVAAFSVVVTVTASTEGVKLPSAATGLQYRVLANPTVGVKVYPFLGDVIGAAATNGAYALVKNTVTTFFAVDTVFWRVMKGG